MPRSSVTSTHAAPSSRRYCSAWSSTLLRSEAFSRRSRNCGTCALKALIPANAVVRPVRNAWTPRRTPATAWRIDSSAVRFATSDVSPSVTPSAPMTTSVAAMNILARRPSRGAVHRIACSRLRSKRRRLLSRYRNRQVPQGPAGLGGKPAFQLLRCERAPLGDERSRVVHLRSEEHTSELQSQSNIVCRLLLEKKKHTSEPEQQLNIVCRIMLGKMKLRNLSTRPIDLVVEQSTCQRWFLGDRLLSAICSPALGS